MDCAICRCLLILVDDEFTDMACDNNAAAGRILDAMDVSLDACLHSAVLEHEISIGSEGAIHQSQVLAIAQRLFAGDVAADERQASTVPTQVFSIDLAIGNRDVLCVPKRILAVQERVLYLHILAVLEGIVALEVQLVDADVVGAHAKIVGILNQTVLYAESVAVPQHFLSIGEMAVQQLYALHPSEHLRGINQTMVECAVLAIPEGRAGRNLEVTVLGKELTAFPEDILPLERAVIGLDVAALLDAGLPEVYRYMFESCIMKFVKRTLAAVFLVLNNNHIVFIMGRGARGKRILFCMNF